MTAEFKYRPDGEVLRRFMAADDFFRGVRGPVGSGKTSACCVEVFRRALQQVKAPTTGTRMSRWAVVRNSYPELRTTTIETWKTWFPESVWGNLVMHPPPFVHRLSKGDLDCEVLFIALDRPDDVRKLLSLDLTGAWLNEARELPKSIVDAVTMRVGRYPSMKDGGPSWYGVIADTNSMDDDNWWPILSGEAPLPDHISREEALMLVKPDSWRFFTQPSAMTAIREGRSIVGYEINPLRENKNNLTRNYYQRIIEGKGSAWIQVYVLNELGSTTDGKPVYADFDERLHVADDSLQAAPGIPILIGMDFGLTPAAVFCQRVRGRWLILREIVARDMGIVRFAEKVRSDLAQYFPGANAIVWGDPSGDYRVATDEKTPLMVLRKAGFTVRSAPTNDPALRIEAVTSALTRLVDRRPAFTLDPSCVNLRKGFQGGYAYRRMQVSGERFEDKPDKNQFSHVHDALQYALCGGGESRNILGGSNVRAVNAKRKLDVFARTPLVKGRREAHS